MNMLQMERQQMQTLLDQTDDKEDKLNSEIDELNCNLQVYMNDVHELQNIAKLSVQRSTYVNLTKPIKCCKVIVLGRFLTFLVLILYVRTCFFDFCSTVS